jgi:PKD repeat protein
MKQKFQNKLNIALALVAVAMMSFFTSCEKSFRYELPEANSIADTVLPQADFSYIPDANDYRKIDFSDQSIEMTKHLWDFGNGNTSTDQDASFTFPGEGTYQVTLTVSDENGASNTITKDVEVIDVFVPLTPTIINGDFEDGQNNWQFSSFTGGTTSPYNSSADGSWLKYDGTDNGSKTGGAKWTKSTSAGVYLSANTRYAYQELVVSPNVEYVLEYEYAIKTPLEQTGEALGGNRIIGGIIDGYYADGAAAIPAYDANPILQFVGTEVLGKTVFTKVEQTFISNASGEIAILIYGVTDVDAYVDNVKVYPK